MEATVSVPLSERSTPSLQYVTTAKDIAYKVEPVTSRYPSHQWNSMGRYMVEDASLALRDVQLVDAMFLRTEDDLQHELNLLDEALGYLAHLEVMTDLSIRAFRRLNAEVAEKQAAEDAKAAADENYKKKRYKRIGPSENDIQAIADKIINERELIGGIKRKAPKLLNSYLSRKNHGDSA